MCFAVSPDRNPKFENRNSLCATSHPSHTRSQEQEVRSQNRNSNLQNIARPSSTSMPRVGITGWGSCYPYITPGDGNSGGMLTTERTSQDSSETGLCARCRHVRTVRSDRGSIFYLCRRSLTDPGYPQYPRLPVLFCRGYETQESETGRHQSGK
jgi:hypothetical protein